LSLTDSFGEAQYELSLYDHSFVAQTSSTYTLGAYVFGSTPYLTYELCGGQGVTSTHVQAKSTRESRRSLDAGHCFKPGYRDRRPSFYFFSTTVFAWGPNSYVSVLGKTMPARGQRQWLITVRPPAWKPTVRPQLLRGCEVQIRFSQRRLDVLGRSYQTTSINSLKLLHLSLRV